MSEKATGIISRNADAWVATFEAAEQAEGHSRLIQIVSLTSGKIGTSVGAPTRTVASNDSSDTTTFSGSIVLGDNNAIAAYIQHSQSSGNCIITPLICDNNGAVVGGLNPLRSTTILDLKGASNYYLGNTLIWDIKGSGGWKIWPHVSNLSDSNTIKLWIYTV